MRAGLTTAAALTFSAVAGSTSGYICSFMEMSCETKPAAAEPANEVRNRGCGRTYDHEQSLAGMPDHNIAIKGCTAPDSVKSMSRPLERLNTVASLGVSVAIISALCTS